MIHMKCQDLFSRKNNKKLSSAAAVTGALRVKIYLFTIIAPVITEADNILFFFSIHFLPQENQV